ncbi:MAG: sulfurtransferase TusA family protein [Gammaproteobacteria bacterium]|nr:sulfurtransferase TusA family protein [Gammaproteobacteria bacterium]MDH5594833.1 sulfurtransferase TusA family protein [Gammaproteobacteria bacterium]
MREFDIELDTTDLVCPYPIIKTKKILNEIDSGQVIHVITTDFGSFKNFPSYSRQHGHEILEHYEADGVYHYYVKKG